MKRILIYLMLLFGLMVATGGCYRRTIHAPGPRKARPGVAMKRWRVRIRCARGRLLRFNFSARNRARARTRARNLARKRGCRRPRIVRLWRLR